MLQNRTAENVASIHGHVTTLSIAIPASRRENFVGTVLDVWLTDTAKVKK